MLKLKQATCICAFEYLSAKNAAQLITNPISIDNINKNLKETTIFCVKMVIEHLTGNGRTYYSVSLNTLLG